MSVCVYRYIRVCVYICERERTGRVKASRERRERRRIITNAHSESCAAGEMLKVDHTGNCFEAIVCDARELSCKGDISPMIHVSFVCLYYSSIERCIRI